MAPTYTVTAFNPTGRKEITYETGPDGIAFHADTPEEVRDIIRLYMGKSIRLRIHYGDTDTGKDWLDLYDVEGRIGRSTGRNEAFTGRPGACHECGTLYPVTEGRGCWLGDRFYDGCRGWD